MPSKLLGLAILLLSQNVRAETDIFPLRDIHKGLQGTGKTVFAGTGVEDFHVDILGVLRDAGPGQAVILARLSGGPLQTTGVMQGMSGSPVYIDGKLAGAVALAFPFSKEPIAGIRPIEEMLRAGTITSKVVSSSAAPLSGNSRLSNIATPLSFLGFTDSTLTYFAPELERLGLMPRQGVSSGGRIPAKLGDPSRLKPGDMISVQLLSGDMSVGADGTVTAIDGSRVYAFGHQFLASGTTDLPFARAEVITLLPSLNASFKISSAEEWMGSITQDRSAAIAGELGRRARTIPVSIRLTDSKGGADTFRMEMVNDPLLTPLLLQMAVFSTIQSKERAAGPATFEIRGTADFQPGIAPLRFDNSYAGDLGTAAIASSSVASAISYALSLDFNALRLAGVNLEIRASEKHRLLTLTMAETSRREVAPGETVDLAVTLSGPNGEEVRKKASYHVPVGTPAGALQFFISDATSANLAEYGRLLSSPPRSPAKAVAFLNGLRGNRGIYIRVSRADAAFTIGGETLPDPPPSLALILAKDLPAGLPLPGVGSKIDEIVMDSGGDVVTGTQTVQVQVKP